MKTNLSTWVFLTATFNLLSIGLLMSAPPQIVPSTSFQHKAVEIGWETSFTVSATGSPPLSYQWQLNGVDLPNQTNKTIAFSPAKPADEGDYTVVVTNSTGRMVSDPARLWVVPPGSDFIKGNLTNQTTKLRLPYFYLTPTNYSAAQRYPLVCVMHGTPGDEYSMTHTNSAGIGYLNYPAFKASASYREQTANPLIMLWPTRRTGDDSWTPQYLQQVSELLDRFVSEFSVDTNRVYIGGGSEGVHAAWDLAAMKPGFFAGLRLAAGWSGSARPTSLKSIPVWAAAAADDDLAFNTRMLVHSLLLAGGSPIYTEYRSGGHMDGIGMAMMTPVMNEWLLAQRLGSTPTNEPLLKIALPTSEPFMLTAGRNLALSGSALACGCAITRVGCTNLLTSLGTPAIGTNDWTANIGLQPNRTNIITVTATTTSWAAGFGGNTLFTDTLLVSAMPVAAHLSLNGTTAILTWSGGAPPYHVRRATDLTKSNWALLATNVASPLTLSVGDTPGFYRIISQ